MPRSLRPPTLELRHFALDDPELEMASDGTRKSKRLDDTYSSGGAAVEESRHVFLEGSGLRNRWSGHRRFVIAELGFGTGRNFLATWDLLRRAARKPSTLHYVAVEGFPPSEKARRQVVESFVGLEDVTSEGLSRPLRHISGTHRLTFEDGRLLLTVIFGTIEEALPFIELSADCWYVDGFASRKNPAIWDDAVLDRIFDLSAPGATLVSSSAETALLHGLRLRGASVSIRPGVEPGRETFVAALRPEPGSHGAVNNEAGATPARIAVLGGGIAGVSVAAVLARRGLQVTLVERDGNLLTGASGNRAAIVMPHISVRPDLRTRFYLSAFHHLLDEITRIEAVLAAPILQRTGVLQLLMSNRLQSLARSLDELRLPTRTVRVVEPHEATALAGMPLDGAALYYSEGGWLRPGSLAEALLREAGARVTVVTGAGDVRLERAEDAWRLRSRRGDTIAMAPAVVVAAGADAASIPELASLPLGWNRGQVIETRPSAVSGALRTVLCYDGYLTPARDDLQLVGATYEHDRRDVEPDLRYAANFLLPRLAAASAAIASDLPMPLAGRAALRGTTRDRLPLVGPVPAKEAPETKSAEPRTSAGLYASVGHGSRGVVSSLLAAEIIASWILDEPAPVPADLIRALHPARFALRENR